jgi:hypothetical protein
MPKEAKLNVILDMGTARACTRDPSWLDRKSSMRSIVFRHAHPSLCTAKRVRDYYFHGKLPEANTLCKVEFVQDVPFPRPSSLTDYTGMASCFRILKVEMIGTSSLLMTTADCSMY